MLLDMIDMLDMIGMIGMIDRYVEGELLGMRSLFEGKEATLKAQLAADLEVPTHPW